MRLDPVHLCHHPHQAGTYGPVSNKQLPDTPGERLVGHPADGDPLVAQLHRNTELDQPWQRVS